jgi:hypothetical protein
MALTGREPHPLLPIMPPEYEAVLPPEHVQAFYDLRRESLEMEKIDPLQYGYEPAIWAKADEELRKFREENPVGVLVFVVLGGIRSSKTEWRSKRTVHNMLHKPDYKVWASHSTQESSREAQQSKVHKYIPPEFKSEKGRLRVGTKLKVNYTPWGGFTENVFTFPSSAGGISECRYKFYSMDPRSLEGAEVNEGWLDEQAEIEWLNAYIGRCATRNGVVFLTFAAIDGYTPLVKAILNGATTLEWAQAKFLPTLPGVDPSMPFDQGGQMVPRVQENLNMVLVTGDSEEGGGMMLKVKARIVYFHTTDNPYGNPEALVATYDGAAREKIMMMLYGVPTRAISSQLNFTRSVHVMKVKDYQALVTKLGDKGTRYLLIDPCSGRNWFMAWVWFWAPGKAIIYREWPSTGHPGAFIEGIGDPGPWALPGKSPDGSRGAAQRPMRFGYERYVEEIAKAEGWWDGSLKTSIEGMRNGAGERIFERLVDGRYAVSPTTIREGATTWIEQMQELGLSFAAMASEKQILSRESDGSLEMINRALGYDPKVPIGEFSPALARINEPDLHVLETCQNVIYAMETWTGRDGQHGACKDPIDVVRGIYLTELDYVDHTALQVRQPWMGQFQN